MERPQAPHWDIDRSLDQPEDEFFGLIDDLPGGERLDSTPPAKKQGLLSKILGALVEPKQPTKSGKSRRSGKDEIQELRELEDFQPAPGAITGSPELTSHIQHLSSAQDKLRESFLAAEQSSSLFEDIQVVQRKRHRTATWSLWIMAALFGWIGYHSGNSYLQDLTSANLPSETWLINLVGGQTAFMLSTICGILAPVGLFWVGVLSLHLVLSGLLEFKLARIALGLAAMLGGLWVIQLLGVPALVSALLASLAIVAATRALEWLLVRMGWY